MLRHFLPCVLLALCSCSRARTAPVGPQLCPGIDKDTQSVSLQIDESFLSSHDVSEVLDPVWWTANIYDGVAEYDRCLTPFSKEQRLMFALLWYLAEVDNGGHSQFFYNSTGIVFPDALAAMEQLKIPEGVAILGEARRRLGGSVERDRALRQADLERLNPKFDDLDSRLYDLDQKLAIRERSMVAYVRAHPTAFLFHGVVPMPTAIAQDRKR